MSIYVLQREIFSPKHWGDPARLPPCSLARQNLTRTFNCTRTMASVSLWPRAPRLRFHVPLTLLVDSQFHAVRQRQQIFPRRCQALRNDWDAFTRANRCGGTVRLVRSQSSSVGKVLNTSPGLQDMYRTYPWGLICSEDEPSDYGGGAPGSESVRLRGAPAGKLKLRRRFGLAFLRTPPQPVECIAACSLAQNGEKRFFFALQHQQCFIVVARVCPETTRVAETRTLPGPLESPLEPGEPIPEVVLVPNPDRFPFSASVTPSV